MGESVIFDKLREDGFIACHLAPEQRVIIGTETLVAELSEDYPRFQCVKPYHSFVVPSGNMWFAVSLRSFRLNIGYREILPYYLEEWPDQVFQLGFNCSMQLHVAHLGGLVNCIRGKSTLNETELRNVVREDTIQVIRDIIKKIGLLSLEHNEWVKQKAMIEGPMGQQLFPVLYDLGLCLSHQSLLIQSFAKPTLKI